MSANISRFFDLRGPSLVIDTACSSALVAMNMAIQALQNNEIEAAVVGGVNLLQSEETHRLFEQRGILSNAMEFHIFDQRAHGIVPGEGAGLVLLKKVDQALHDGDRIYATVQSIAINNDGRTAGPASPNIESQKQVIQSALAKSGKRAEDITYIEVNGSGSEITDLLELKAIQAIYRSSGSLLPCALGSFKPNIGHPMCAEGIAGFIKVAAMLHNKQFVPFLSGKVPMKHFDISSSPFKFSEKATAWPETPQVAAINCFADGGTNAHIIMEAWQALGERKIIRKPIPVPALNHHDLRAILLPLNEEEANSSLSIWESFK
jgi:acyl transferase domain-containing protein